MGIEFHSLKFLKYCSAKMPLGDTVMIGRQSVHVPAVVISDVLHWPNNLKVGDYADQIFLDALHAKSVQSIDNSDFQGADHIIDMNRPLGPELRDRFQTVFDGGCTEHIFDVAQASRNISSMTRIGGQIAHIVPSNDLCGHGFYQFSPELYFSLYSTGNGFADTEVFVCVMTDHNRWVKLDAPVNGKRLLLSRTSECYLLVRTRLVEHREDNWQVQQSDYVHLWTKGADARYNERKSKQRVLAMIKSLLSSKTTLFLRALEAHASRISPRIRRQNIWRQGSIVKLSA